MTVDRSSGSLPKAFTAVSHRQPGGSRNELSTEALSTEVLDGLSTEEPSAEGLRPEASTSLVLDEGSVLGGEARSLLLAARPASRKERSAWLLETARSAEIGLILAQSTGLAVSAIDVPFACPFHGAMCPVRLTHGRNGEVVYHDPGFATVKREFQTIPELAVALRTKEPKKLRPIQVALWRIRLLHEAGLLELRHVALPPLAPASTAAAQAAREGFALLVRCRWFLDPGEPVAFTRAFVELWCGLAEQESRQAIFELVRRRVIVKVGEAKSGFANATHLYAPGPIQRSAS